MDLTMAQFDKKDPESMYNLLSSAAVADGADYIYKIDKDTEFLTGWTSDMVSSLKAFKPANVGIVEPACKCGNDSARNAAHHLVHRCFSVECW